MSPDPDTGGIWHDGLVMMDPTLTKWWRTRRLLAVDALVEVNGHCDCEVRNQESGGGGLSDSV